MLEVGVGVAIALGASALAGTLKVALTAVPFGEWRDIVTLSRTRETSSALTLDGAMGAFLRCVREAADTATRIDLLSERMAQVDIETRDIRKRAGMWVRVAVFSGGACAISQLCWGLGRVTQFEPTAVLLPFGAGVLFALGAGGLGRWADCWASRRRDAWDRLCEHCLRPLMPMQLTPWDRQGALRSRKSLSAGRA